MTAILCVTTSNPCASAYWASMASLNETMTNGSATASNHAANPNANSAHSYECTNSSGGTVENGTHINEYSDSATNGQISGLGSN